jgi:hypothetical protein
MRLASTRCSDTTWSSALLPRSIGKSSSSLGFCGEKTRNGNSRPSAIIFGRPPVFSLSMSVSLWSPPCSQTTSGNLWSEPS